MNSRKCHRVFTKQKSMQVASTVGIFKLPTGMASG